MMPNRRYAPKKATDSAEAHNRTVRFDETQNIVESPAPDIEEPVQHQDQEVEVDGNDNDNDSCTAELDNEVMTPVPG